MIMAASTIAPMAIAMPPSDMMFEVSPSQNIGMNEEDDRNRQRDDRHQRRAHVPEEHDADQRDHDAFLDELFAERIDGAMDQFAAVIDRHHAHSLRQRSSISLSFFLMPSMTVSAFSP